MDKIMNIDSFHVSRDSKDIIEYWVIKILFAGGMKKFLNNMDRHEPVAEFFELGQYVYQSREKDEDNEIQNILREKLRSLEKKKAFSCPLPLKRNIDAIAEVLQLSSLEKEIIVFVIYLKLYTVLDEATETLGDISFGGLIALLSVLLDQNKTSINKAVKNLVKIGLIKIDKNRYRHTSSMIELFNDELSHPLATEDFNIEDLLNGYISKCDDALLRIKDFNHLKRDIEPLRLYLEKSLKSRRVGVNILLYGPPGTGKTEFTKALSKTLNTDIYEVAYTDEDGDAIRESKRLDAYRVAQNILKQNKMILMFDEIENVLDISRLTQNSKALINRVLEENAIPTIWISNKVQHLDAAIIRRFDMVVEIPVPKKEKRLEIIRQECHCILDKSQIQKIATNEDISPALITRTAKVVKEIEDENINNNELFERILNNTLEAQGYEKIKDIPESENHLPETYNVRYINTDANLEEIVQGIKEHPNARMCLYGIPGTGKSAFGKWIAKQTDRPFIVKKGSDLLSKWLGGTEKNIANAFEEAKEKNAVLIFDEVDSFLQDRRSAQVSWEVTQVNEMLVQMENFNGVFIATTNLMSGLDQASLRRFDLKLEFRSLKPEQAWELFLKECILMDIDAKDNIKIKREFQLLKVLTPGDFTAVKRQNRFRPIKNASTFIERLKQETLIKEQSNHIVTMGFLQ